MGESTRERDLVLAPNEYAFISDQTKGNINVYVGPYKTSLANTDQPVGFNESSKRFERCSLEQSTQIFATAPEGWYIVLKNPAKDGAPPKNGTVNNLPELDIGHKVNRPGPVSFALWPGQMSRILKGHHLRSNQYLLARVYDEDAALRHWSQAVIKPQNPGEEAPELETPDLTMGKLLVIRGTDVSFYIPPTGIEVVRDPHGQYVREAVTLERLEYCILLDEDGNKRFIQGPDVVYPTPTETFVERQGTRKFRAIELNENSGIYVKVIAPYREQDHDHKVGDELFITGREQMIYFPRPEHAIIKYGSQEIHYAVAIPAGEGRYVLNRQTGQITLARGPAMLLPDPRHQVIVRRILEPHHVRLWFPGNQEALSYNQRLKELQGQGDYTAEPAAPPPPTLAPGGGTVAEDFTRRSGFTQPRTITLDTKYEGAVAIAVWTGYAIRVVSRTGERKVLVGPQTYLLEYGETLEPMSLSRGRPKTPDNPLRTVYLRALHNKVSDRVMGETQDLCRVQIDLSYRVNFTGDPNHWFNVEDYVRFLTDHLRSRIRNAIKQVPIEHFYSHAIAFLRDTVLGVAEEGKRPGQRFEENGMHIYDLEVLDVRIDDPTIETLLTDAQRQVVQQNLALAGEQRRLTFVQASEAVQREVALAQSTSRQAEVELQIAEAEKQLALRLTGVQSELEAAQLRLEHQQEEQALRNQIHLQELERKRQSLDLDLSIAKQQLDQRLTLLNSEVQATVAKAEAVSPDLIAALQAFGDKALAERMAETMAPLAILGGTSVVDALGNLLRGTRLEEVLLRSQGLLPGDPNK